MTALWASEGIASATGGVVGGGTAPADFVAGGVTFDSREVMPGDLFIALKGEQMDGHAFLPQAFAAGAGGAIVSDAARLPDAAPHVLVADTFAALNDLGRAARARMNGTVIGVTGSAGKTGVKEALRLALERSAPGRVHASVKSYNNHTGVPLSLARMPEESVYGVFEMGMNHPGELTELAALVRPHVAIITTIASAHRAFFDSEEAIADAKAEIFTGLEPGGTAILNKDNPHYARLRAAAEAAGVGRIVTFGLKSTDADVRPLKVATLDVCTSMTADVMGEILTFKIGLPGEHWALNALGVLAAVKAAGGDLGLAGLALGEMQGLEGRGKRTLFKAGAGQAMLLDESYNANPASMSAALSVLGGFETRRRGRRIAVLGSMKELGDESDGMHAGLVEPIEAAGVSEAVLVGTEMTALAKALPTRIPHHHVATADEALTLLRGMVRADDIVLVKGSNSVGLGRVVRSLNQQGVE
ncbi:MAG TPA: UDP-N-acetylmuramoyl-tripeptide--D-alanyl-D-alanine ligase [Pedomonas sp.]|uniref:UDP-N-acetylmuramoyl-tripeptide--D-alanyl-D- alanine ligase n=1 Tax=Pedomonas sp. TaxID=2976421 RepID=UPI002F3E3D11